MWAALSQEVSINFVPYGFASVTFHFFLDRCNSTCPCRSVSGSVGNVVMLSDFGDSCRIYQACELVSSILMEFYEFAPVTFSLFFFHPFHWILWNFMNLSWYLPLFSPFYFDYFTFPFLWILLKFYGFAQVVFPWLDEWLGFLLILEHKRSHLLEHKFPKCFLLILERKTSYWLEHATN